MKQARTILTVDTPGPGLTLFTRPVASWVSAQDIGDGLLTAFIRHTSASLLIQENADPDVLADLRDFFARVAPKAGPYRHDAEGADDMPAHIRASLTQTQLSIPVSSGRLDLGTWQGLYVFEHRDRPHRREVVLHLMGE